MVFNILWKQRLETSGLDPKLTNYKFAALLLSYIPFFNMLKICTKASILSFIIKRIIK